ncbi:MAG: 5-formyltetrahydrofolate cyclo-ligase [Clostridia bacterium]|nr:5-formyltetrahydrofolate cyclo-ligase [Clostridia bacterium]
MIKKQLRQKYRNIRSSVSDALTKSELISARLTESYLYKQHNKIFLYYPSGREVSTVSIAEKAFADGKMVAFPKCLDRKGTMEFRFINSFSDLEEGMFGIMEPDSVCCGYAVPDSDTLIVVPALAFDMNGNRLGYGGGYYDRYLSQYDCCSVGLAYSECICNRLPTEEYDVKINCLISDTNILYFNTVKEE